MIKPKFHQFNCREQNRVDLRQARAVLKYKPDIIIFEQPEKDGNPESIFNKYDCKNKPFRKVSIIKKNLKEVSREFRYALSMVKTFENIERLWHDGHDILLYNVDGPQELRADFFEVWYNMYPCATKNWLWWVYIYLRERIMANHIHLILKKYKIKNNPKILIFIQSFHWKHVKFLLSNPSKKEIWNYYFGKFSEITPPTIAKRIRKNNELFYKYWEKYSDF
ncbi:MAG: hypothetical protein PHE59_00240 [Patescibacteria group bacterium]|nr:hypothetical protein [Patescibacteria group bacterium]MDD5164600.1 hypothetical protein [Patescibacteria group bacterium]MDD5534355.1 hypothetical protein [Patescibacteria group bacterium]